MQHRLWLELVQQSLHLRVAGRIIHDLQRCDISDRFVRQLLLGSDLLLRIGPPSLCYVQLGLDRAVCRHRGICQKLLLTVAQPQGGIVEGIGVVPSLGQWRNQHRLHIGGRDFAELDDLADLELL
jgi:hypothetical protein